MISLLLLACASDPSESWSTSEPADAWATPEVEVVDVDGEAAVVIDVSIPWEEFKALADANDLWDVPLDADGNPVIEPDLAKLSSSCSIPSSVTTSVATQTSSASKSASCYNYAYFDDDPEADCYIKFSSYSRRSAYLYDDTNTCARTADVYYGHRLAAYYDSSSNVYLRMDGSWCRYSNCEDGFKITY